MYFACSFIEMQFEVHCTFDPPNAVHPDWFIMLLSGDATTDALRLTKQWKQITILLMVSHTFDLKSAQFRILIVICIECMLVQGTSIGSGQCIVGSVVHSVHFENLITIYCLFENILNARSQLSSLEGAWNLNVFNWSGRRRSCAIAKSQPRTLDRSTFITMTFHFSRWWLLSR